MTPAPSHGKTLLAGVALAAVFCGVNLALQGRTHLSVFEAIAPLAVWSLAVCGIGALRALLALRAHREKQDRMRDSDAAQTSALFAPGETDPFSAARTAAVVERQVLPAAALLIAVALGIAAWRLFRMDQTLVTTPQQPLLAGAFLLGEALALFLFSRYLIGLARATEARTARAPGIALGLFALAALVGAGVALAAHLGWTTPDRIGQRVLAALAALLAVEHAALFLIALYLPAARRPCPIESRLGASLTDPAAWTRDVAASLDYQFGIHAGHGALLRFFRRALLPLIALQLLLIHVLSCFVFLGPGEEGILERWGRPVATGGHLASGFHLKAPWPVETVRRLPARRALWVYVGFQPQSHVERPDTIQWTVPHYRDEDVFVTAARRDARAGGTPASVNLVSVNLPVEYRITNLMDHAYRHRDPAALLRDIAYRALTRALARRDLLELLGADRLAAGAALRAEIQQEADRLGLGVEIQYVGLQGIHPPILVAEAFQSVVAAIEEKEAFVLGARAYAASVGPRTDAEVERRQRDAEANRVALRERADAEAELFNSLREAQQTAPAILRQDLALTAQAAALAHRSLTVLAQRGAHRTLYFDLKQSAYPDLYELFPPSAGQAPHAPGEN